MSDQQPMSVTLASEMGALRQAVEGLTGAVSELKQDMGKRMDGFEEQLRHLVTKEAFDSERRTWDARHDSLRRDLDREIDERKEAVAAEAQARQAMSTFQRWIVGVLVTVGVGVISLAVTVWANLPK